MARSEKRPGGSLLRRYPESCWFSWRLEPQAFGVSRRGVRPVRSLWGGAGGRGALFPIFGAALAGTLLGYLIPSSVHGVVRYIAALIACAAIRWTLNDLKRIRSHALFAPVALCPLLLTGLAMGTVDGFRATLSS